MTTSNRKETPPPTSPQPAARGPIKFTSQRCLNIATMLWEWSLATLPLDFALLWLLPNTNFFAATRGEASSADIVILLILIAALGTIRGPLLNLVERLRHAQKRIEQRHITILLLILAGLGALEIFVRVFAKPLGAPIGFVIAALIFIGISGFRGLKQIKKHGQQFLKDRLAQVEQANTLHLGLVIAPIIAARLVGLSIAIESHELTNVIIGTTTALVLLFALKPDQRDFMSACPRCQRMTSRALKADGCCPQCSPEKFLIE